MSDGKELCKAVVKFEGPDEVRPCPGEIATVGCTRPLDHDGPHRAMIQRVGDHLAALEWDGDDRDICCVCGVKGRELNSCEGCWRPLCAACVDMIDQEHSTPDGGMELHPVPWCPKSETAACRAEGEKVLGELDTALGASGRSENEGGAA